ncbi:MAG: TOBE domain-containing protein [bacterium]|nr:TOBE domain-containing protein [bacterium]
MDEPLGHLEEYLRVELRREIRALHEVTGGTTFYITHDQEEAAAVSDRIAVMANGELQQVGAMPDLIDRPENRFVAEFVGEPPISMFDEIAVVDGKLEIGDYSVPLSGLMAEACRKQSPAAAGIRPAHFAVAGPDTAGLSAIVQSVQPMGEWAAILCDTPAGPATVVAPSSELPSEGAAIKLRPDTDHLHLFLADGRNIALAGG